MEFQFQLLDGINFDTTEYHDIDLTTYKLDLEKLLRVENVPFHEIPSYLRIIIAMSIRDSSFIISFRPHSLASNWKTILSGTLLYDYKIDLIDLDLKPIEKLEKYINEIKLHG